MTETTETIDCELCIVGAGYAALNGLNAAAKYLKQGARVVVIDKNDAWGGQWLRQYDFVRLHQPYQMFTAGDQPWTLERDASHLATRREVLDHLGSVPAISAGHLEIRALFGHAYRGHSIQAGRAEVDVVPVSNGLAGRSLRVRAQRLLKATGTNIEMLPAFPLSSTRVRSVGVSDPVLMTSEFLESGAPVYIIGSGKTAMDCVQYVARSSRVRRRAVNILIGSGMWFLLRDELYPGGRKRFTHGQLVGNCMLDMCERFDGQNEVAVMEDMARAGAAIHVFGQAGNCRYGMLSLAERDNVLAASDQIYRGHLVDVEGTQMTVLEGKVLREVSVAEGSWFINCTSHLREMPHEPVLQDSGVVCAPQVVLGFSGTSAYYLTHLWYRDELAPIAPNFHRVRVDVEPKLRLAPQLALTVLANMMQVGPRLPLSIPAKFRGDFARWYPLYRRALMVSRIMAKQAKLVDKAERLLPLRYSDPADAAQPSLTCSATADNGGREHQHSARA